MHAWNRFSIALSAMLAGLLLVPFVALPREGFRWQLFVGAYGATPTLAVNYDVGRPGSDFLISGFGFSAGAALTLRANSVAFGTVTADGDGRFEVWVNSNNAGVGQYVITAEDPSTGDPPAVVASTTFYLLDGAPLRQRPAGTSALALPNVPGGLGDLRSFLPMVMTQ
ncbi:MAG: hypothetical protein HGA45_23745 [Chloroflexales bacterium]|nr:hypothetical protein [Chloroflexales bacterium]